MESQLLYRGTRESNHSNVFMFNFYIYLAVLTQHALPVITIMVVWQFVHLGTRMYSYMLLAFKTCCVNISRKIQKQYDTNKNHLSFIMVPFLVYINHFLLFFLISVSWKVVKNFKIWSFGEFMSSKFMSSGQRKYFALWSNCKNCSQWKFLPLI